MVRIILHTGFHKTGTTSAQTLLETERARLAPYMRIALRDDIGELPAAARAFSHDPGPQNLRKFQQAADQAFSGIDPDDLRPMVVSAEDLSGAPPGRQKVRDYSAAISLAGVLRDALRARIGPEANISFVYTTREAATWLASLWWQNLRVTRAVYSLEAFAETYAQAADFDLILRQVRSAVPDCRVESVALEQVGAVPLGTAAALLRLAGVPERVWPECAPRLNMRPALGLEDVFLALNRSGLPDPYVKEAKKAMLRKARRIRRGAASC